MILFGHTFKSAPVLWGSCQASRIKPQAADGAELDLKIS